MANILMLDGTQYEIDGDDVADMLAEAGAIERCDETGGELEADTDDEDDTKDDEASDDEDDDSDEDVEDENAIHYFRINQMHTFTVSEVEELIRNT